VVFELVVVVEQPDVVVPRVPLVWVVAQAPLASVAWHQAHLVSVVVRQVPLASVEQLQVPVV
jgi:hypothetical protein